MPPTERVRSGITDLRDLAAQLMEQTHQIACELRPARLDDLGLESALLRCVEIWTQRIGITGIFRDRPVTVP